MFGQFNRCVSRWCPLGGLLLLVAASAVAGAEPSPAGVPRPEHPMPQMMRAEWLNLNGTWEFGETDRADDAPWLSGRPYPDKIVVPFCRRAGFSGLGRTGFVKKRLVSPHFPEAGKLAIEAGAAARRRERLEDPRLGQRQSGRRAHRRHARRSAST